MVEMPRATLFFVQGGLKWLFAASGFEKKTPLGIKLKATKSRVT